MHSIIHIINVPLNFAFDLIVRAFGFLSPFWSLTLISLLAGWLMLWVFGKTSNQKKIKSVKSRIGGHFLSVRLFGEHLGVFFRIQGRILRDTLTYMRLSLTPMLVLIIPVILIMVQIHLHFAARPLKVGEQAVLKANFSDISAVRGETSATLSAPSGVTIETKGIHIESLQEIAWRIRAETPGTHHLTLQVGENKIEKDVVVEGSRNRVNIRRTGANIFDMLLYPGEAPIAPETGVASVEIIYPELKIQFLGIKMNWLIQFLVMSSWQPPSF